MEQQLTSFRPSPDNARTSFMTFIFDADSKPTSFRSKNSFAGALSSSGALSATDVVAAPLIGALTPAIGIIPPIIGGTMSTPARPTLS